MILQTKSGNKFIVDDNLKEEIINSTFYFQKNTKYISINYKNKPILFHRFIMNAGKGDIVDHINRNKTDNRLCNLRFVSASENNYNRGVFNKNGRGITLDKCGNRYRACISVNNKTLKLGSFKNIEEAKIAYNKKAKEIYGDMAFQHELNTEFNEK